MNPYELVSEDDQHFIIRNNGKDAAMPKRGLGEEEQDLIRSFPRVSSNQTAQFDAIHAPDVSLANMELRPPMSGVSPPVPIEQPLDPRLVEALAPQQAAMPVQQQPQMQPQMQQPMGQDGMLPGFAEQRLGIAGQAQAQAQGELQKAAIFDEFKKGAEALTQRFAQDRATLDTEQEKLKDDYAAQRIDPNQFWNKQTGVKGGINRVLSLVGLFLGGIGSVRGGVNPARAALDNMINADIDAQKENRENTKTLLNLNLQKYKDLSLAEQATKLDMYTAFKAQVEVQAAKSNSKALKAGALIELGQLTAQEDALKNSMAKGMVEKNLMQFAISPELSPDDIGRIAQVNPEMAAQIVPGVGYVLNKTEAPKVAAMKGTYDTIANTLNQMAALRKSKGVEFLDRDAVATGNAMQTSMVLELKNLAELGVLSKDDIKLVEQLIPNPTSMGVIGPKYEQAKKYIQTKTDAFLRTRVANFKGLPDLDSDFKSDK